MALFKKDEQEILDAIKDNNKRLAKIEGKLEATEEVFSLTAEIGSLKTQVADLEIQKSLKEEKFARERRDIEHKVGLEKTRQEFEKEQSKREATVEVKEKALTEQEERFKEHVNFVKDRLSQEVDRMDNLVQKVLNRLPEVQVERKVITHEGNNDVSERAEEESEGNGGTDGSK